MPRMTKRINNRLAERGYVPHIKEIDNAIDYDTIAWRWWFIGIQNMINSGYKAKHYRGIAQ